MARGLQQLLICVGAFAVYFGGRWLVEGSEQTAISNARRMLSLESTLGIDIEQSLQDFVLRYEILRTLGNITYVWFHWPLIVVALVLLYHRDLSRYLQLRNALVVSALVGILIFGLYPEAPPRFLSGYVGTVDDASRRLYLGTPTSWNNQYASFVSYHVGWTLIACLAVAATFEGKLVTTVLLIPGVLTSVAVITTGNHFVLDAAVGGLVAVAAYHAMSAGGLEWLRARTDGILRGRSAAT